MLVKEDYHEIIGEIANATLKQDNNIILKKIHNYKKLHNKRTLVNYEIQQEKDRLTKIFIWSTGEQISIKPDNASYKKRITKLIRELVTTNIYQKRLEKQKIQKKIMRSECSVIDLINHHVLQESYYELTNVEFIYFIDYVISLEEQKYPIGSCRWYRRIVMNSGLVKDCIIDVSKSFIVKIIIETNEDSVEKVKELFNKPENIIHGVRVEVSLKQ